MQFELYVLSQAYSPVQVNPPGLVNNGPATLSALIDNVLRFGMYAVGVIGVVMIIYSAFLYVTSIGRPDRVKQALNSIIYTAVGLGISIIARSLVEFFIARSGIATVTNVSTFVNDGISLFMWVIGVSAVIVMIISGLLYVVSGGDPGKTKTAKDAIMYAAIGLGVAVIGGALVQFIGRTFGL